jgi:hypothetical protein
MSQSSGLYGWATLLPRWVCHLTGHKPPRMQYSGLSGKSTSLLPEGKTFCTHCHNAIVLQWILARCSHCNTIRAGQWLWGQLRLKQPLCTHCGHTSVTLTVLERPKVHQLRHAMVQVVSEEAFITQSAQVTLHSSRAIAWIDRVLLPKA